MMTSSAYFAIRWTRRICRPSNIKFVLYWIFIKILIVLFYVSFLRNFNKNDDNYSYSNRKNSYPDFTIFLNGYLNNESSEYDLNTENTKLPLCSKPVLFGELPVVNFTRTNFTEYLNFVHEFENDYSMTSNVNEGGWFKPDFCISSNNVAIIVPYRDREEHLPILLAYLHTILQRQLCNYRIFVVEQYGNGTFNKGQIMNAAFLTVRNVYRTYTCFVFHDVDLIPENDQNLYSCSVQPKHMSPAVNKFGYELPYNELIGGVLAIDYAKFEQVNGYSNLYWGWGGEDDDLYKRLRFERLQIERPPKEIGRYSMLPHVKRTWTSHAGTYNLLRKTRLVYKSNGLNSLQLKNLSIFYEKLFTHIVVDIKNENET